ncbi:MAG: BfmA/BtgA family mobilization protein [Flavobacteriaceae bacterium]
MMTKKLNNFHFSAISIKDVVASRFRMFSKRITKTHTETLTLIMDFFEWHGFLPSDRFGQSIIEELLKNRKRTEASIARTNASIAIIKDIEKNHDKPTTAMLQILFEGVAEKKEPVRKERMFKNKTKEEKLEEETTVPKVVHERTQLNLDETKKRFRYVLDRVSLVNNRFGKDYLKLELFQQEFTRIKRELKKD